MTILFLIIIDQTIEVSRAQANVTTFLAEIVRRAQTGDWLSVVLIQDVPRTIISPQRLTVSDINDINVAIISNIANACSDCVVSDSSSIYHNAQRNNLHYHYECALRDLINTKNEMKKYKIVQPNIHQNVHESVHQSVHKSAHQSVQQNSFQQNIQRNRFSNSSNASTVTTTAASNNLSNRLSQNNSKSRSSRHSLNNKSSTDRSSISNLTSITNSDVFPNIAIFIATDERVFFRWNNIVSRKFHDHIALHYFLPMFATASCYICLFYSIEQLGLWQNSAEKYYFSISENVNSRTVVFNCSDLMSSTQSIWTCWEQILYMRLNYIRRIRRVLAKERLELTK